MARPAGFSDSEDEFDDYIHPEERGYSNRNAPQFHSKEDDSEKDAFEEIQVPSFKGLTPDVNKFKDHLYEGNFEGVKEYVKAHRPSIRGPLITDSHHWEDYSPLEIAASSGHESILSYLLKESSSSSMKESPGDGACPLMAIASANNSDKGTSLLACAKLLLTSEDVNRVESTSGMTPLMLASKFGFVELVELMVNHGAFVDNKDFNKWTALCHAANAGHGDVVRYLLVHANASSSVTTSEGFEPSDLAERKGHKHVLEVLDAHSESRSVFRGAMKDSSSMQNIVMILNGFGFNSDEIEAFSREGVQDLASLLTLTEKDITERIGIKRIGVVKSLSEFIKDMHRKEWKRSCLPRVQVYDPSKGLKFSCPESISVMGNIRKQLLYLRSSVIYLQRGIAENPEVLQIGKDMGNVSDLYKYCGASVTETEGLLRDLIQLRRTLYPYLTYEHMPADEIKFEERSRLASVLKLTTLASIPLCIYIIRKYI